MSDTEHQILTIETILGLFADEAAEFGEPRDTALERAYRALAAHDAELTERVRAEQREADAQIAESEIVRSSYSARADVAAAIREAGKTEEAE